MLGVWAPWASNPTIIYLINTVRLNVGMGWGKTPICGKIHMGVWTHWASNPTIIYLKNTGRLNIGMGWGKTPIWG